MRTKNKYRVLKFYPSIFAGLNLLYWGLPAFAAEGLLAEKELALDQVKVIGVRLHPETLEYRSGIEMKDMPVSVSNIKHEEIEAQGAITMTEVLRNTAGLQAADAGMANDFRARGLGITFFRDGIFDGNAQNGYYRSLVDMEEVEVLKGPGAALFGSSAPGASINLVTKKPNHKFAFSTGASLGSFGLRSAFTDVTGEISQGSAGRLIVHSEKNNGYRGLGRELLEVLPSITFDLAENKSLLLDLDYRKSNITPDNYGIPFNFQRKIADVDIENRYYTPFANVDQTVLRLSATHDWFIRDNLQMKTTLVSDTRNLKVLRNVRGNAENADGEIIRRSLRQQFDDAQYLTLQNEFLWDANLEKTQHHVTAGLAYQHTDIDTIRNGLRLPNIANISNPVVLETTLAGLARDQSRSYDRVINSNTLSVYLNDHITLNEQWKLSAGLRNEHVEASDKGSEGTIGYREIAYNKNLLSGNFGLVYQPTQHISFYTSYTKGAFNNINTKVSQLSVNPETSQQIELGSKTQLFDQKLELNAAAFQLKRNNYLFDLPEAESTSDGKDLTKGIELELTARPMVGLSISGNAIWMRPTVETDVQASLNALAVTGSTKGTEPVGVSRRVYNAWAQYVFQRESLKGLSIGLGANYRSETYADALNQYQVPAFLAFDANLSYKIKNWSANLAIKNLTNREYFVTTTNIGSVPAEERNAVLSVTWQH